jgi:hypothetical protein
VRFISESTQAEGTVVDWTQGARTTQSSEPGAYFRIIEIETPNGRRIRGQAEVGVDMRRLEIGKRVAVRYRISDPTRMRIVSLPDLWLVEMVTGIIAIAFCLAGWFLMRQAGKALQPSIRSLNVGGALLLAGAGGLVVYELLRVMRLE